MTVLVAAASRHRATQEIAEAIGETLEALHVPVEVARIEDIVTVFPYDAFVLGSAVYIGSWLRPARRFNEEHAEPPSRFSLLLGDSPLASCLASVEAPFCCGVPADQPTLTGCVCCCGKLRGAFPRRPGFAVAY
jgi:menaquinone-dependent protoporphyrinogen oxidase